MPILRSVEKHHRRPLFTEDTQGVSAPVIPLAEPRSVLLGLPRLQKQLLPAQACQRSHASDGSPT
ncbi:hypothetical protein CBM2604_U20004 [Cupriavidus taiwanensis]|nr:hypothetical protein CBM2604_U20004 [Cupriavidus taiwanensis]